MGLAHYGVAKLVLALSVTAGAAFAVMDPTTKGYVIASCIAAIPPTITGVFNHFNISAVAEKVDGINARLTNEKNVAVVLLTDASKQLAHAEGRAEGIKSEQDKKETQ